MNFTSVEALSRDSLRIVLREFDPIPDVHRLTVWKTILFLPNNKNEYLVLRDMGKKSELHVNNNSLSHRDESQCKTIKRVIQSLLSHCPTLKHFSSFNLTGFVDSFAALLSSHELIYFEVVLSIMINYCQHWFDHIPSLPYSLLSLMDIILLKSEPELYKHLASRGVRAIDYAWEWMSTAFKMIVDPEEYFHVWDHILINEPSFIYFLPLAACKLQKRSLLHLKTNQEIKEFMLGPAPLDWKSLMQESYHLYETTPTELHPKKMTHSFHPLLPGSYPMVNPTDLITFGTESATLSNLRLLLGKVEETAIDIEAVLEEGLVLRRKMID